MSTDCAEVSSETILDACGALWRELLSSTTLQPDDDLLSSGATSLMFMMAFMRINERHSITIPLNALIGARTFRQFAQTVSDALAH